MSSSIFKAYDIRGVYPNEIDEKIVYAAAQAYAKIFNPKVVVLGRDVRLSGTNLFKSVEKGLRDHGVDVIDIGVVTTDMMYFAAGTLPCDGGITISASHNPREYNGLKMVAKGDLPISYETGIAEIERLVNKGYVFKALKRGEIRKENIREEYVKKCLSFIDKSKIKSFKVVLNAMNGPVMANVLAADLPIKLIKLNEKPDGSFPKGQPDPMQEKNRVETSERVLKEGADLGAAWDADADRFFLFDEKGRYIPGYYLTAFLGEYFSKKIPGAKIIHDARLIWAVKEKVRNTDGQAIVSRAGHSLIKALMRKEDAVFAGEASGHYYYRDFFYADNGFISFLLCLQIISESEKRVSQLFDEYFERFPISGEINLPLQPNVQIENVFNRLRAHFSDASFEEIDGLSINYRSWRANVRGSNTEPLLRVNLEANHEDVLHEKQVKLLGFLSSF